MMFHCIAKILLDEVIQDFAELANAFESQCMTCGISDYDMKIKLCSISSRSHQE